MNLYMSLFTDGCYLFSDGLLIVGYKNKMGTDGGGGGGGWRDAATIASHIGPGLKSHFFLFR